MRQGRQGRQGTGHCGSAPGPLPSQQGSEGRSKGVDGPLSGHLTPSFLPGPSPPTYGATGGRAERPWCGELVPGSPGACAASASARSARESADGPRPAPVTRGAARTAGPAPDPRSWKPQGGLAGEGPGTHVVRGSLLAVHGPRHVHAAGHGVDAEDLHGRLVRAHARDAVADGDVVVFVGADLEGGAGGGASGLGVPRRCREPRVGVLRDLPCAHQAVGRPRHRVLNDAPWGVRRAAGTH